MTSLPSFVELMASLGLDQTTKSPDHRPQSTFSSPSASPRLMGAGMPMRSRSKSTQSLKESKRDRSPMRAISPSSRSVSPPRFSRRSANKLSVNPYGSASDLAANTPISSYVRRKTPGASPTSPTFPHESRDSLPISPMPMTVPTLPAFWPNSSSGSFPTTKGTESPTLESYSLSDIAKNHRRGRRSVGTRISTPSSADLTSHYPRRRSLAHIC
ncbi:hypothetical protein C0995_000864 [Termitomyces sp. Mi166|nr:hypothetical protein C0995_000864 [Termitomyces sp. Mi166\